MLAVVCPNHNNGRATSAYNYRSVHSQNRTKFVLQVHPITRASMPKRSNVHVPSVCVYQSIHAQSLTTFVLECIRSPWHHCPKHDNVRVTNACDYHCVHAQTIITFMFERIRLMPGRLCPSLHNVRVTNASVPGRRGSLYSSALDYMSIRTQTIKTFVFHNHVLVPGVFFPRHPCPNHENI